MSFFGVYLTRDGKARGQLPTTLWVPPSKYTTLVTAQWIGRDLSSHTGGRVDAALGGTVVGGGAVVVGGGVVALEWYFISRSSSASLMAVFRAAICVRE